MAMNIRWAITISAATMSLALAGGCKQQREEPRPTGTTGDPSMMETSRTATGEPTEAPAVTVSSEDRAFMTKAASGGMLEVTLGADAAKRGTHPDVKAFGNHMVRDHGKANDELKELAAKKGVVLPAEMNEEHKELVEKLSKLSGAKFDAEYASEMVDDHEEDIKEFKEAASEAKDADLRAWAAKTVPILEGHLTMAKDLKAKTKPKT
jgi:putative membrane protein